MSCITFHAADSPVHRTDARARVLAGLGLGGLIAVCDSGMALFLGAVLSGAAAWTAQLPSRATFRRLMELNGFMVLLWLTLPFSFGAEVVGSVGPLNVYRDGVVLAVLVTVKANILVLLYTALLSTIEMTALGEALRRLGVPARLAHLYCMVVRYADVFHHENERLRQALRARCYRPALDLHTLRTTGYLVGMLLVRSEQRSRRVVDAMKCRGWNGEFHALNRMRLRSRDRAFLWLNAALFFLLLGVEYL